MLNMQPIEWIYLLAAIILLLLSGFFSAAEIGLLSVNRFRVHQLAEEGDVRGTILQSLLRNSSRALTVILILITGINYANESLTTTWLHNVRHLPEWVPFTVLLVGVLIFAEVTPINYAAANPERIATRAAPIILAATRIFHPLITVFTTIANGMLRLLGGRPTPKPLVTGEEVRTIVDIETERGVLEEEEKELIHSIFEFSDTVVREIMVPRIDITAVDDKTSIARVIDITIEHQYSRLPVYHEDIDHIIGLVHVKDLLSYELHGGDQQPISVAMRQATFIPETKSVSELLQEFRETKQTLAIVIDEYGGTAGLVTVEDLLEEIVGEIYDEYDIDQPLVEWLDPQTVLVDAKLSIDEISDLIHYDLPEGEYDTVGGLLYSRFGDVPSAGEQIVIDGVTLIVDRLDGHRITKVRILLPPLPPVDEETK